MTQAEGLIEQARATGIAISDGQYPGEWWLEPHGVSLRENRRGRLSLSGATGHGGEVTRIEDLILFKADPEAGYRLLNSR